MEIRKVALGDVPSAEVMIGGDLHYGDRSQDKRFIAGVQQWLTEQDNRFIVFAGDIFNVALKTSVSDVYREAMTVDGSIDAFVADWKPYADKILAVVKGNHDNRLVREVGVDPVKYACSLIGAPYDGAESYMVVTIGNHRPDLTDRVRPIHYSFYGHHGVGGGRMIGGKLNGLKRLDEIVAADIYYQGHTHQPASFSGVRLEPDSQYRTIVEKETLYVMTGAPLNRDGYAVSFAYPALRKCYPVVTLSGKKKRFYATL